MTTKNSATNGVAKGTATNTNAAQAQTPKPELSKLSVSAPKNDEQKNETSKTAGEGTGTDQPKKSVTIAEKLAKLEQLQEQAARREVLEEALQNVGKFHVSQVAGSCNLRFTDSKGNNFGITHPTVIGEMVNLAKSKLQEEIAAIDANFSFDI